MDQQVKNALLPYRNTLLALLKKHIEETQSEYLQQYGCNDSRSYYPSSGTIRQCWDEFLEKVSSRFGLETISDLQTTGSKINVWWVHCNFGLMLYHFSNHSFPVTTLVDVILLEVKRIKGRNLFDDATIKNFYHELNPNHSMHWSEDIDSRAGFLYRNIQSRLSLK